MRKARQKKSEAEERAERVLRALSGGALCWEELQMATHLNDDQLGMVLTALFEQRLIRTRIIRGTRLYLVCAQEAGVR